MPENRIDELVDLLGCSIAEAKQIITDDKAIDKGERVSFDLDPKTEKQMMKLSRGKKSTPTTYNWSARERKENVTKSAIIAEIFDFLVKNGSICAENVQILNKERQISFQKGEDTFELTLVQKRKSKKPS